MYASARLCRATGKHPLGVIPNAGHGDAPVDVLTKVEFCVVHLELPGGVVDLVFGLIEVGVAAIDHPPHFASESREVCVLSNVATLDEMVDLTLFATCAETASTCAPFCSIASIFCFSDGSLALACASFGACVVSPGCFFGSLIVLCAALRVAVESSSFFFQCSPAKLPSSKPAFVSTRLKVEGKATSSIASRNRKTSRSRPTVSFPTETKSETDLSLS